jgi:hypothetical protein
VLSLGLIERSGSTQRRGNSPAIFYERSPMKILSVFVDESGDYGEYNYHSPYYIVTMVFHDQSINIDENISMLDQTISLLDLPNKTIHMGPLIRREGEYRNYPRDLRIKAFRRMFAFAQKTDYKYQTFVVEKKQIGNRLEWNARLTKEIGTFIKEQLAFFTDYDRIIIYYDSGQSELTGIIVTIFNTLLANIEFRLAKPTDYKLLQVADLICTLELLSHKIDAKSLSTSELSFFESPRVMKKNYLKIIEKKRFIVKA